MSKENLTAAISSNGHDLIQVYTSSTNSSHYDKTPVTTNHASGAQTMEMADSEG